MLNVEEALRLVEQHARPLTPRRMPCGDAAGLVLAADVASEVNSPPYHKALMDGYAVMSSDRQPERTVLEEIAAGDVPRRPVTPGTTTRLMTGAPLPDGADAIVAWEQTETIDDRTIRLLQPEPPAGQHVLPLGASFKVGDVVLERRSQLRPIEIGILAEIGHAVVSVFPRPRVAVLPTGNELVPVGEKPSAGQIRNSNGPMLLAALARVGADAIELPIARDEPEPLRQLIEQGLAADVLLLCGGVSAGKFDLVPAALKKLGVEMVFHKVALRPGKPIWFGVKSVHERTVLVFGLPGNPVSACVCFELFVRPALAALAGRDFGAAGLVAATLSHPQEHKGARTSYVPARLATGPEAAGRLDSDQFTKKFGAALPTVEILPWHGSADLAALARANALVRLSADVKHLEAGSVVDVVCL